MRQMRADAEIELTNEQRTEFEKVVRSRRTAQAVALRARIVLLTADGFAPTTIAEELGTSQPRRASGGRAMWTMAWRDCATNRARVARGHWTISAWPTY